MSRLIPASLLALIFIAATGCEFNVSTATINNPRMARGVDENYNPIDTTHTFTAEDREFHCVADLDYAPDGTHVKAIWRLVKAEGEKPDQVLVEKELQAGGDMKKLNFTLTTQQALPSGDYACDLYINPKSDGSSKPETSVPFVVQ